jgi:dTMP kinase
LVLGGDAGAITAEAEALLFAASRAQLVAEAIRPALARGEIVVVDRFVDSSLAYQWGGRGLPLDVMRSVQTLATGGLQPDLKILLDLPVSLGLERRLSGQDLTNRLDRESAAFHERVRQAYHSLAAADPERWRIIDASLPEAAVWAEVWRAVTGVGSMTTGLQCDAGDGPMDARS